MKKNRKIIPAILLIATTAFASFACKNKADTKTKPVDKETAFAVCNTAFQGTKNAEKFTKTEQISYKNELEDAFSYAVDYTTFDVEKGIFASAQSEKGDYTFLKCAEKVDDTYNVVRANRPDSNRPWSVTTNSRTDYDMKDEIMYDSFVVSETWLKTSLTAFDFTDELSEADVDFECSATVSGSGVYVLYGKGVVNEDGLTSLGNEQEKFEVTSYVLEMKLTFNKSCWLGLWVKAELKGKSDGKSKAMIYEIDSKQSNSYDKSIYDIVKRELQKIQTSDKT